MKRTIATITALAASAGLLFASTGAEPASANASGCTYTAIPRQYVCGNVKGQKLFVNKIDVIRGKLDGSAIYDLTTSASVTEPGGRRWTFAGGRVPGKTFGRQYATVNIKRSFPSGSRICGSAFERGQLQDTVCFTIHN